MKLHGVKLNLTAKQFEALARGNAVKIAKKHLIGGSVAIGLTQPQIKRLYTRVQSGNGLTKSNLKLTRGQLFEHCQHGQGFFSDLARKFWTGAKTAYRNVEPHVRPLLEPVVKELSSLAKDHARNVLEKSVAKGRRIGIAKINDASHSVQRQFGLTSDDTGLRGDGFLSDIYNSVIRPIGETLAPVAKTVLQDVILPAATSALSKKLSGGEVKRRAPRGTRRNQVQVGSSIFF